MASVDDFSIARAVNTLFFGLIVMIYGVEDYCDEKSGRNLKQCADENEINLYFEKFDLLFVNPTEPGNMGKFC
jgi:hypothetical protein